MIKLSFNWNDMESSYFHNTSTGFGSYDRYFERVPHYESADFFVCSLHDGIGDTMYNNAYPESIIKKAKEGKVKLLFDCTFEGEKIKINRWLSGFVDYHRIDRSQCAVLSGSLASDFFTDIDVVEVPYFEIKSTKECSYSTDIYEVSNLPKKKYSCLNRKNRPHRVNLVARLKQLDVLKYGNVSLGNDKFENYYHSTLPGFTEMLSSFPSKYTVSSNEAENLFNQLPLEIDENFGVVDEVDKSEYLFTNLYTSVDFALITETLYSSNEPLFVTEKTFKAFACKSPFLILGQPGLCKYLKQRGYRLYDSVIDYSYDSLPDHLRFDAVIDEVIRLCNVNFSEYRDHINEVANHNYQVLLDQEKVSADHRDIHDQLKLIASNNLYK